MIQFFKCIVVQSWVDLSGFEQSECEIGITGVREETTGIVEIEQVEHPHKGSNSLPCNLKFFVSSQIDIKYIVLVITVPWESVLRNSCVLVNSRSIGLTREIVCYDRYTIIARYRVTDGEVECMGLIPVEWGNVSFRSRTTEDSVSRVCRVG